MEKTCPTCYSCGMPLEKASDHALGDASHEFCVHCANDQGELKSYEEIVSGFANYLVHSQGIAMVAATEMAQQILAKQPAWKDRHGGK